MARRLGERAPGRVVAILVGIACAVLSILLRVVATPYIGDGEALLTAFPLVLVASLATGGTSGITCLVLCTLASWYLFIGDRFTFSFGPYEPGILAGTFIAGSFVVLIAIVLRRAFRDIMDLRATERLLSNELEHRIKNTLTLVLSISRQTFRDEQPIAKARDDFEGRMIALAAAQDLVGRADRKPTPVSDVVAMSLKPFCGEALTHRVVASGPSTMVDTDTTVALFLVLHELATNSAKYGALSAQRGAIDIAWSVHDREGRDTGRLLAMSWTERDGPPVRAPERQGFGTKLMHRLVSRNLKGSIVVEYPLAGVRAELSLPI